MFSGSLAASARPLAVVIVLALGACQSPDRTIALEDPDEAKDFQQCLDQYASSVDDLLRETKQGENVSSFSLGMLSYNILITVSSTDKPLYNHFYADGQDVQDYLKTKFQANPEQEIAALDEMRAEGNTALRTSARYTLEALTHLPRSSDPPDVQQRSREQLAVALKQTETSLTEAAGQVRLHY